MTWGARLVLRDKTRGNVLACFISALVMLTLAIFDASWLAPAAYAQSSEPVIEQIAVQGNQRVEPATIRTYLTVREGDPFDPVRIDRSIKNLFATGLFADVSVTQQGTTLLVRVVENPIVNRVQLEGNNKI